MGESADGSRGPIHFLSTMLLVLSQSIQAAKIKSHKLGAYNQHTFISHSSGTLKSGCQHGLVWTGGAPLLEFRQLTPLCVLTWQKGTLVESFNKGTNPIHEGSTLMT